jgi:hypothetical protein
VKIVRNDDPEYLAQAAKEFKILEGVDHPNIVKMLEF